MKFTKKYIVFFIAFVIIIIFSGWAVYDFILEIRSDYQGGVEEKKEYPELRIDQELNELIIKKKMSKYVNNRGVLLETSKSKNFFSPAAWNLNYEEGFLPNFIMEGDSIEKLKDSDTIHIHRKGMSYIFILNKTIEKEDLY